MDEQEELRILIAAQDQASGPMRETTSASKMLKDELKELYDLMQKFGTKKNYQGFERGMESMEKRMKSLQDQSEKLRQQQQSLNRTMGASGNSAMKAADKYESAAQRTREAAKTSPVISRYGAVDPKGIQETHKATQAVESHTKSTNRNTKAVQSQGRMFGFAAREIHGLRLGIFGSIVSAGFFTKLLADMAVETSHLGEELQNVELAFDRVFAKEGLKGSDQLEKMRKASKGLVNDFDLMKTAVFVAQFPFENLKVLLPEIIEASTNLALAQGKDIPQGIDDMVRALGRGSSKILDNLGVILKIEQAHAEYARQLGKTTKELTKKEKAESFAVIGTQKLIEKGAQFKDLSLETNTAIVRLENAWHKFAETFSNTGLVQGGLDILANIAEGAAKVVEEIDNIGKEPEKKDTREPTSAERYFRSRLGYYPKGIAESGKFGFGGDPFPQTKQSFSFSSPGITRLSGDLSKGDGKNIADAMTMDLSKIKKEVLKITADRLRQEEGWNPNVYLLRGIKHIGYGRNIEANPLPKGMTPPITREQGEKLMMDQLSGFYDQLNKTYPYFKNLSPTNQSVLTDMSYNMGPPRLSGFKRMHGAFAASDTGGVKREMLDSLWHSQLPGRSTRLTNLVQPLRGPVSGVPGGLSVSQASLGAFNYTPGSFPDRPEWRFGGRYREPSTEAGPPLNLASQDQRNEWYRADKWPFSGRGPTSDLHSDLPKDLDPQEFLDTKEFKKWSDELDQAFESMTYEFEKEIQDREKHRKDLTKTDILYKKYMEDHVDELKRKQREIEKIETEAYRTLSDATFRLAKNFGSSAQMIVSSATEVFKVYQNYQNFQKLTGPAKTAGEFGTAGSVLLVGAQISNSIGNALTKALESPSSKLERAADRLLESTSRFAGEILAQDPDYQKLRKELLDPLLKSVASVSFNNRRKGGTRFDALKEILGFDFGYGGLALKYARGAEKDSPIDKQINLLGGNPFDKVWGSWNEPITNDLLEDLKSVFGPDTTFNELLKESIKLSDHFRILSDMTKKLTDLQKQSIKDEHDIQRANLRGQAARDIRDAGDNFVRRHSIVNRLRSDLEQIRITEQAALARKPQGAGGANPDLYDPGTPPGTISPLPDNWDLPPDYTPGPVAAKPVAGDGTGTDGSSQMDEVIRMAIIDAVNNGLANLVPVSTSLDKLISIGSGHSSPYADAAMGQGSGDVFSERLTKKLNMSIGMAYKGISKTIVSLHEMYRLSTGVSMSEEGYSAHTSGRASLGVFAEMVKNSLSENILAAYQATPPQVFDLSKKLSITTGNLASQIRSAIDSAVAQAVGEARNTFHQEWIDFENDNTQFGGGDAIDGLRGRPFDPQRDHPAFGITNAPRYNTRDVNRPIDPSRPFYRG